MPRELLRVDGSPSVIKNFGEIYAKPRPAELISKYGNIKNTLNQFDNLPTTFKPISLLSTLQCFGEL